MDVFQLYAIGTAGWAALQSLPALMTPGLLLSTLSAETHNPTSLELYLTRFLSLTLLSFSVLLLSTSGVLQTFLATTPASSTSGPDPSRSNSTHTAILAASTLLHSSLAVLHYTRSLDPSMSSGAMWLQMVGDVVFVIVGGGLLMFGSGAGSERKMRSHMMFETPEHRAEVKERHKGKKGL